MIRFGRGMEPANGDGDVWAAARLRAGYEIKHFVRFRLIHIF